MRISCSQIFCPGIRRRSHFLSHRRKRPYTNSGVQDSSGWKHGSKYEAYSPLLETSLEPKSNREIGQTVWWKPWWNFRRQYLLRSPNFYYYIAVSTDAPALDNMAEYTIPKATWAVFENSGQFKEDVQSVFRRFLTEFLPLSGYVYAGLPDIEVYPFSTGQPVSGQSQVWIAIKKAKEV